MVIQEAVRLAERYGSGPSARFVNNRIVSEFYEAFAVKSSVLYAQNRGRVRPVDATQVRNRERTGVPERAARLG